MKKSQFIPQFQYLKGVYVSSEEGRLKKCQICSSEFNIRHREHQCKRCKRAVCSKCSPHRAVVNNDPSLKGLHRQCTLCKDECESIKKFIEKHSVAFQVESYAPKWLKKLGITKEQAIQKYEEAQNDKNKQTQEVIDKVFNVISELGAVYNYSIREFLYYVIKDERALNESIMKIIKAFLNTMPEVGFNNDLVIIIVFLLCFGNEAQTYSLLILLYQEIIPVHLYPVNAQSNEYDYEKEIEKILQILLQGFKINQGQATYVRGFMKNRLNRYLSTFTINFLQIESTIFKMKKSQQQQQFNHVKTVQYIPEKQKNKKCPLCSKDYTIKMSEVTCKRCKRSACPNCVSQKISMQVGDAKEIWKVCGICKEESDLLKKFVESNKIQFLKDSLSKQWLEQAGITLEMAAQKYADLQGKKKDAPEVAKMQEQIFTVISEFGPAYNYSMKEFMGIIAKSDAVINESLIRVLSIFLNENQDIPYSSDQVIITQFLLCFGTEASTLSILEILHKSILQSDGQYADKIVQQIQLNTKASQIEIQSIRLFLKNKFNKYLSTLTINLLQVETTIQILSQIITDDVEVAQENFKNSLGTLFQLNIGEFKQYSEDIEWNIFRNTKAAHFKQKNPLPQRTERRTAMTVVVQPNKQLIDENEKVQEETNNNTNRTNNTNNNNNNIKDDSSAHLIKELHEQNQRLLHQLEEKNNELQQEQEKQIKQQNKKIVQKYIREPKLEVEINQKLKDIYNDETIKELKNYINQITENQELEESIQMFDKYVKILEQQFAYFIEQNSGSKQEQQNKIQQEHQVKLDQMKAQFEKQQNTNKLLLQEHELIISKLNKQLNIKTQSLTELTKQNEVKDEQLQQMQQKVEQLEQELQLQKERELKLQEVYKSQNGNQAVLQKCQSILSKLPSLQPNQIMTYKDTNQIQNEMSSNEQLEDVVQAQHFQLMWFKLALQEKQNLLGELNKGIDIMRSTLQMM